MRTSGGSVNDTVAVCVSIPASVVSVAVKMASPGVVEVTNDGLNWTTLGSWAGIPDHGLWARGADRMYVHRTNGHYGFPLRVGVPAEESVLELVLPALHSS